MIEMVGLKGRECQSERVPENGNSVSRMSIRKKRNNVRNCGTEACKRCSSKGERSRTNSEASISQRQDNLLSNCQSVEMKRR